MRGRREIFSNALASIQKSQNSYGRNENYLLNLLQHCSEEAFGQDAVEHAIVSGAVTLTYDLETDLRAIMGEPGMPETGRYSEFIEAYQRQCREHEALLADVYASSGLLAEILRPVPSTNPATVES